MTLPNAEDDPIAAADERIRKMRLALENATSEEEVVVILSKSLAGALERFRGAFNLDEDGRPVQ